VGTGDDVGQISQLMAKYSLALDDKDAQGWASTFTPNGIFHGGGFCLVGRGDLAALVEKQAAQAAARPPSTAPKSHHVAAIGPIVYQDRNHATVHSFVMVVRDMARNSTGGGLSVTGTYDDNLERVNGRWLFADRLEISPGDPTPAPCPAKP
jgi:hypothetical protein